MTKTLFLPMRNFFPNRHKTFISHLQKNFSLIAHEDEFWNMAGTNIINTKKISAEIGNIERLDEFHTQWAAYKIYIEETLHKALGFPPPERILAEHFQQSRTPLAESLKSALLLGEIAKEQKIDAIVCGADYTRFTRPIVFMAHNLGIPTIQIEHGLFSIQPYASICRSSAPTTRYASNYLLFDNELEVDILKSYKTQPSVKQLLALGTPLDNLVSEKQMSKEDARSALSIDPKKKCITLVLSWSEPRGPMALVRSQADEIEFVKFVLETLQSHEKRNDFHIIVKLHPAIADFKEQNGAKHFYAQLCATYGFINNVTILVKQLTETVAASDALLCCQFSSVLWDSIMQHKETALFPPKTLWKAYTDGDWNSHSAVASAGLSRYIKTRQELHQLLNDLYDKHRAKKFPAKLNGFTTRWNIKTETAAVKSQRIISWLKNDLPVAGKQFSA